MGAVGFSLPTQRCFFGTLLLFLGLHLFSAYAEVFLVPDREALLKRSFLCLRRGVSSRTAVLRASSPFSLPTQRCFLIHDLDLRGMRLFSAYAEVFLPADGAIYGRNPFLCLRRGVSGPRARTWGPPPFSLPTQRCFRGSGSWVRDHLLFSAYAEVFLNPCSSWLTPASFSLPTQRCFPRKP